MKRTLLIGSIVMLLVGPAAVAGAPKEAPRVRVIYRDDMIQRARLAAWCWPGENGGMGCSEKDPLPWPDADTIEAGSRSRVRIDWRREPRRIHVDSHRSVRKNGRPRDRGTDLRFRKEPVKRDGRIVAWDIVFRVRTERHHYVQVLAHFRKGTLVWDVHLKAVTQRSRL